MAPDRIRDALQATPFRPFTVEPGSGEKVRVKHPDFAHLSPAGKTLVVYGDDDDWSKTIDVFLINSLTTGSARSVRRR